VATILVLGKAWAIMEAFSAERPELDLQEIRAATGLPATTCLRLVRNLVKAGLLAQIEDRYRVGLAVLRWAGAARSGLRLGDVAMPFVERLRDETGETAGLFVREGASRVCIAIAETRHSVVRRLWVGHTNPLHVGAPGKVLLAFDDASRAAIGDGPFVAMTERTLSDPAKLESALRRIRKNGYATSFGEWDVDVVGIAAPVFGPDDRAIAAIGISAPALRLSPDDEPRLAPLIVRAARDASEQVSHLAVVR
jgi:IclR family acetate operon transcriptional repressor